MDTATNRPSVFVSYSHQDEAWKDRLVKQLRVLELEGDLEVWDDRRINAGDDWLPEIEAAMARARAAVLLISPDFLTSGFIRGKEVPEILRRRESEGLRVIAVIVHPCAWTAVQWISKIQCRPKDGKELDSFPRPKAEKHLADLALEIRGLLASPLSRQKGGDGRETGGEGPPLHNLPYLPLGDLFTGRQEELDAFAGGGTAAITQSAAISGLGGIGKTRLAVEYAWRSGNRYTAAWFVRADSPENLSRNLAALASPELLSLPEGEARDEDKTVVAVKRWLREHPGWLMILDNVDTPEAADAVLEALPSLSIGRVLITTRLTTWPAGVRKQSLDKLSPEEAVDFLLHRTDGGRETAADDAAQAANLAERVDGLPLALEQAAAYIIRHRMRFADYLRAWEQEHDKLLQWYDPRVMQYPASVAVTWKQTFDRLSPTPAALLRLTAFLAPDPISFEMLEQGTKHVKRAVDLFCAEAGTAADGKTVREATADLADYSLITRQKGGMLVVHRMVQEALRSQVPEEHRRVWIEGALRIVDDAAPVGSDDVRTWPVWDSLRPHVAEVVARADKVGIGVQASRLMNGLGGLLLEKGLYSEAEPLLHRALDIAEVSLGPHHSNVAIHLSVLALLLKSTNRLEKAEPLMRRALAIDEAFFGNQHPNVAKRLNNLATLLYDMNRLGEAELLMRRTLDISETSFGSKHPNVATTLNNLAQLLKDTNRLGDAEALMRRALDIDVAAFGNEHPNVATALNNLGLLLKDTNRLGEAEPLIRRALDIDVAAFGNEHPNVARDLNNLAQLFQSTNRLEEAEPLMRRALDINVATFGDEHPNVARDLNNLAQLFQSTNRLEEAEPLMRHALDIDVAAFGNEHPNIARDLNNLAQLLKDTNRLGEAEPLMRRAVEIFEASLGPEHPNTGIVRKNLEGLLAEIAAAAGGEDDDPTAPEGH